MAQMVRKQIYLLQRQQAALRRVARVRGISEAKVIRQAIDANTTGRQRPFYPDSEAWEQALRKMISLSNRPSPSVHPRRWKREDAYEERLSRYERHSV